MAGVVSKKSAARRSLLEEINIRGIGVIDNALVEFKPGLNVITGETGAGKTMLLTALSLILGGKTDSDLVRQGHERLTASGSFRMPEISSQHLSELLAEHEPELDDSRIIFSRSVTHDGKSRAQLCGTTTTASILNDFGGEFIEIHGQHANLVLSKAHKQRELLDTFGGESFAQSLEDYRETYGQYLSLKIQIAELKKALADRDREIASLKEIHQEFSKLKAKEDELEELDNLISRLESVEDLRIAATGASQALSDEEQGVTASLHQVKRFLQSAKGKDATLDKLQERVSDSLFNLIDVGSDLEKYLESLSADPKALESALNRRAAVLNFAKKFGNGSDRAEALKSAIAVAMNAQTRIQDLTGGDTRVSELEEALGKLRAELLIKAKGITSQRNRLAEELSGAVTSELHDLAMQKALLKIEVETRSGASDADFMNHGLDEVVMLFTAHGGGDLLPIAKAASGGELSRLMLAIEVVIAQNYPLGTYVFDEVDAGVGGKAALEVGRRLRELSKSAQVIVVTHLAQVAIWADNQIVVEKDLSGSVTESTIRTLREDEREREIARMLSGVEDSEHAQEHARELLNLRLSEKA